MKKTNQTIQTYSKIYQDYADRNVLNDNLQALLDKFINKFKGKTILDIGCAQGRDSCYFSSKGYQVTGIDLTPEFIALAQSNCPKAKFELMDMRQLEFKDASFDGIWACASFLHIPKNEALRTLREFRRVIKPNGVLYISVMDGDFEGLRTHETLSWGVRYFSHYIVEEFTTLLDHAGFTITELVKSPTHWGPLFLNFYCQAK